MTDATEDKTTTVYDIAQDAIVAHPDIESAFEYVKQKLDDDTELRDTLASAMIDSAIRTAIYSARHTDKTNLKQMPNHSERNGDIAAAMSDLAARSMLDSWRMDDGRVLGDVKGGELAELAEGDRAKAGGFFANAAFYEALAAKTPPRGKVRNAWKTGDVRALWERLNEPKPKRRTA